MGQEAVIEPQPAPMGLFQPYLAKQPETIILKERIRTKGRETYEVRTVDGRPLLHVTGGFLTVSGRKEIRDSAGTLLYTLRKKGFKMIATYAAEDANGNELFDISGKWNFGPAKSTTNFVSPFTGKQEGLVMTSGVFSTKAAITEEVTGQPVAIIDRRFFTSRQVAGHKLTYAVTVAPNVDIAMIVALCICMDERRFDDTATG